MIVHRALVLVSKEKAEEAGLKPLAHKIRGLADAALHHFATTARLLAIPKAN